MTDVESQTMSLRKRKNPKSALGNSAGAPNGSEISLKQQLQRDHNKFLREVNAITDADLDDEETKEMKKKMMTYQMKNNDAMANFFMRLLTCIIIAFVIIYCIALFNEPTDEPGLSNALLKALRILVGIKPNLNFLSSFKIVASTSVAKSTLDEFLIPQWPWQRTSSSNSKYLVPVLNKPVKHILHETMKLKYQHGINVELFDEEKMRHFLMKRGHECENKDDMDSNKTPSIVEKFDELNTSSTHTGNGAKSLWLWCMMYTGETFGHLDIEDHIVEMNHGLTKRISLQDNPGGLGNVLINPILSDDSDEQVQSAVSSHMSLSKSILFVSSSKSKVAEGMIKFILQTSSFNEYTHGEYLHKVIRREKEENWTLLNPHCKIIPTDEYNGSMVGRICTSKRDRNDNAKGPCCYLVF